MRRERSFDMRGEVESRGVLARARTIGTGNSTAALV